jgi:hypothetical protein
MRFAQGQARIRGPAYNEHEAGLCLRVNRVP